MRILPAPGGPGKGRGPEAREKRMLEWLIETISNPYLLIVILTLMPALELRASIPYGILMAKEPVWLVVLLAVAVNILLGPVVFFLLDKVLHLFLKVRFLDRIWQRVIARTQRKIKPKVDKYGIWGLAVFIGVPLPGSGVYSGAVGGYLLGFTRREFYIATVCGVLIAAAAVTIVCLTGAETFKLFIKDVPAQ